MCVVLDTNIFSSALTSQKSVARQIYEAARSGRIALVTCDAQIDEIRRVTRYPRVPQYIRPGNGVALAASTEAKETCNCFPGWPLFFSKKASVA